LYASSCTQLLHGSLFAVPGRIALYILLQADRERDAPSRRWDGGVGKGPFRRGQNRSQVAWKDEANA
jgi:hypothetical protein